VHGLPCFMGSGEVSVARGCIKREGIQGMSLLSVAPAEGEARLAIHATRG
jgi:hypothetical protein